MNFTSLNNSTAHFAGGSPDPGGWYAVYVRHQHEKVVAQILTVKGFEVLLPLYQSKRRWKDRTKTLSLPLFPSYVFIKGGLERRLDVLNTPSVHHFVSCAGRPSTIPPDEIDPIRRAVESVSGVEPHPLLKCGDRVEVKTGPLAGIRGFLVRRKNSYRLVLGVQMLGQAAAVEIDGFLVERLQMQSSGVSTWVANRQPDCSD